MRLSFWGLKPFIVYDGNLPAKLCLSYARGVSLSFTSTSECASRSNWIRQYKHTPSYAAGGVSCYMRQDALLTPRLLIFKALTTSLENRNRRFLLSVLYIDPKFKTTTGTDFLSFSLSDYLRSSYDHPSIAATFP